MCDADARTMRSTTRTIEWYENSLPPLCRAHARELLRYLRCPGAAPPHSLRFLSSSLGLGRVPLAVSVWRLA